MQRIISQQQIKSEKAKEIIRSRPKENSHHQLPIIIISGLVAVPVIVLGVMKLMGKRRK
jgi:hypothetical protein